MTSGQENLRQAREARRQGNSDPKPNGRGAAGTHFQLVQLADIKLSTKPNYLIKGLLPRRGLGVIWGPPKCGKSFIAFDIAMHVALGREYRGMRVKQGGVVYLALEGGNGFPTRVEVWRQQYLDDGTDQSQVPFYLLQR